MEKRIYSDKGALGKAAAEYGTEVIKQAIELRGEAYIIVATGASQLEMLENLVTRDVDWSRVTAFHLDEYIGITMNHPASFRKYLKERFVDKVERLREFHYIEADKRDPDKECERLAHLIGGLNIDVAFIGIGENGHLAFNDPPADFETKEPFIVVELDEACRRQQLGEGWFDSFEEIPQSAISMSIRQIMKSSHLLVSVPDARKAEAVKCAVEGDVSPMCPASILQRHKNSILFLDLESSSGLQEERQ